MVQCTQEDIRNVDKIVSSYTENKDAVVIVVVMPTRDDLTKIDYINEAAACLAYASAQLYFNQQEDKNE